MVDGKQRDDGNEKRDVQDFVVLHAVHNSGNDEQEVKEQSLLHEPIAIHKDLLLLFARKAQVLLALLLDFLLLFVTISTDDVIVIVATKLVLDAEMLD